MYGQDGSKSSTVRAALTIMTMETIMTMQTITPIPSAFVFFSFFLFCEIELPLQSVAYLADLLLKFPEAINFFSFWIANRVLATVLFLSTTFADRTPNPRRQGPYFGDPKGHITRKTQDFALDDGWTWWFGWHDGVVDMMVDANHDNHPWLGCFQTKFPSKILNIVI